MATGKDPQLERYENRFKDTVQDQQFIQLRTDVPAEILLEIAGCMTMFDNEPDWLTIKTQDEFDYLRANVMKVKATFNTVDEKRKGLTKPFRDEEKNINLKFKAFNTFCEETEQKGKAAMGTFQQEQQRKAKVLQATQQDNANNRQKYLDSLSTRAAETGKVEKAEELADQAENVQAKEVVVVKAKGEKKVWDFEVTDLKAFIKHASKDPYLINALEIKTTFLKKYISDVNDDGLDLPGIKAKSKIDFTLRK
jgi:hypothetical protein